MTALFAEYGYKVLVIGAMFAIIDILWLFFTMPHENLIVFLWVGKLGVLILIFGFLMILVGELFETRKK